MNNSIMAAPNPIIWYGIILLIFFVIIIIVPLQFPYWVGIDHYRDVNNLIN
jgi:hypothetical protein